jgi:hypothetical protein
MIRLPFTSLIFLILFTSHASGQIAQQIGPGKLIYGRIKLDPKSCQGGSASSAIKVLYQMLMIPGYEKGKDPLGRFRKCMNIVREGANKYNSITDIQEHKLGQYLKELDTMLLSNTSDPSIAGPLIATLSGYVADNQPKAPASRKKYSFQIKTRSGVHTVYLPEAIALFQAIYHVDPIKGKIQLKKAGLIKGIMKQWLESLPQRTELSKKEMNRRLNYYTPARMIEKIYEQARANTKRSQRHETSLDDEGYESEDSDDEGYETEDNEEEEESVENKTIASTKAVNYNPSQPEESWLKSGFIRLRNIKRAENGQWILTGEQKLDVLNSYKNFIKSICLPLYKEERSVCIHYVQRRIFASRTYSPNTKNYLIKALQRYIPRL